MFKVGGHKINNKLNPHEVLSNQYRTLCYINNIVKASNISIGDYAYYDNLNNPTEFEKNNILFHYPEFVDCHGRILEQKNY